MPRRIVLGAVLVLAGITAADAESASIRRPRHARVVHASPTVAAPVVPSARLVRHPAWTFACEAAYGPNRGPACDIPIWVYGSPCEVDIGWGRSRPCYGY